jgi:hypothetical protein
LCDEIAFWRTDDAAEPDFEILDAIRPGMATIPGAMLICASSPHARRGALWDAYRRHFGVENAPLVWQAETRAMNPTVPQTLVDEAMERDPASASAEFGARFRTDIEGFVRREVVEGCVSSHVRERPPQSSITYRAFVDPSGGSADSMTLAVGHMADEIAVVDAVRERRPPFSPKQVVADFCALLRSYGVSEVTGDRYGGEWPREQFRKHGVEYRLAERNRSELYRSLLPRLNSGTIDLIDSDHLVNQIVGLERRVARAGREVIDHPPGGHDDVANAVAGVADLLSEPEAPSVLVGMWAITGYANPDREAREANTQSWFSGTDYMRQTGRLR